MPTYTVLDHDPRGDFMTVVPTLTYFFGKGYVLPNHVVKQPIERRLLLFECSEALNDGDSIATFAVTVYSEDGSSVVVGMIDGSPVINGTEVTLWLQNGTNGLVYFMEMVLTTVLGEVIENDIRVVVREKGY